MYTMVIAQNKYGSEIAILLSCVLLFLVLPSPLRRASECMLAGHPEVDVTYTHRWDWPDGLNQPSLCKRVPASLQGSNMEWG